MVSDSDAVPAPLQGVGSHDTTTLPDGRTLGYATFGDPNGAPVFAFHGTPGSRWFGAMYHDAAAEDGLCVVAPDRPGIGNSTALDGRTVADWPADVDALADHLGLAEFGVLGYSAGGPHALAVADALDERVRSVALVAPAGPPDAVSEPLLFRAMAGLGRHAPWLLGPLGRLLVSRTRAQSPAEFAASTYTDGPVLEETVAGDATVADVFYADFHGAYATGTDGAVREFALLGRPWPFDPADVATTVHVWHGGDDANAPIEGARVLAERLPDCELHVEAGGDHGSVPARTRGTALRRLRADPESA